MATKSYKKTVGSVIGENYTFIILDLVYGYMNISSFLLKETRIEFSFNWHLKLQETLHKHELHKISSDESIENLESAPVKPEATEYTPKWGY